MFIKKIEIYNFKSIEKQIINFSPLTMLVGANASGKSNLINVFRFIQNIITDGIENAVALQGGIQYVTNANLQKGEKIEISFIIDVRNETWIRHLSDKKYALEVEEVECKFVIQPNKKGMGYAIPYDYIKMSYDCYSYDATAVKEEKYKPLNLSCSTTFERKSRTSSVKVKHKVYSASGLASEEENNKKLIDAFNDDRAAEFFASITNQEKNELMLFRLSLLLPPSFYENTFIRIFDFDPKELKKSSSMASTRMLEENGSNLASVLQTILRNKEQKNKLSTLLKEYLPFVENVSIENNPDKSFSYKIRECYNSKAFYANFLSDGTVSILALIISLYFEDESKIVILEEPERNIHPKLLSNLLASAEDVSLDRQVIITTHNPEFLRHANIENVRLVSRNDCGKTRVTSPMESSTVLAFLKNDLGLDDLFLQDMLED